MCGKDSLSAEDLLSCFDFASCGDNAAGALVAGYLRELVGSVLDEQQRRQLLRWATSRSTLPANGLEQRVTLIRKITSGIPDQCLPEAYTCSLEVALPDYSSSTVLSKQLDCALKEMDLQGAALEGCDIKATATVGVIQPRTCPLVVSSVVSSSEGVACCFLFYTLRGDWSNGGVEQCEAFAGIRVPVCVSNIRSFVSARQAEGIKGVSER